MLRWLTLLAALLFAPVVLAQAPAPVRAASPAGVIGVRPGIFGMKTRSPEGVQTTWAKQLALYVVIYSPIQMAADLLENYEANPAPSSSSRTCRWTGPTPRC